MLFVSKQLINSKQAKQSTWDTKSCSDYINLYPTLKCFNLTAKLFCEKKQYHNKIIAWRTLLSLYFCYLLQTFFEKKIFPCNHRVGWCVGSISFVRLMLRKSRELQQRLSGEERYASVAEDGSKQFTGWSVLKRHLKKRTASFVLSTVKSCRKKGKMICLNNWFWFSTL